MKQTEEMGYVNSVTHRAVTILEDEKISAVAERIIDRSVNHVVVINEQGKLTGIVTSWDITKAVAKGRKRLVDIIIRKVVTTKTDESLEVASRRMAQQQISALPVIDQKKKVLGIITSEDIAKLLGR